MHNPESNSNETVKGGKSIDNFKGDSVNGESIVGGGPGIVMPTLEEEALGINNSGMSDTTSDGTVISSDGTVINDDGTISKP